VEKLAARQVEGHAEGEYAVAPLKLQLQELATRQVIMLDVLLFFFCCR
jgi:hypothetical protein